VGRAAAEHGVSFVIVRAVSDLLDEDLPLDFNLFFDPAGWPRGTFLCLTRPSVWVGLNRLRRQSATASEQMTRFFVRFLDDLQ
jgi:adenosylhomocysteine nucleosidase